ncbi:MAG: zinc-ribbon and DUF3426 domain-containing protein [Cocleimonas sp.]
MYTQCEHCKAVFRVNMREVTVSRGKLRCGECNEVFTATNSLSTTMPTTYDELLESVPSEKHTKTRTEQSIPRVVKSTPLNQTPTKKSTPSIKLDSVEKKEKKPIRINWILIASLLLISLLLAQVFYNKRHFFLGKPVRESEKIQMINHNIFAHPNEENVLLISALIENTGKNIQPYPVLELRLSDSQSKLVALRRFRPKEYLPNYSDDLLLPPKKPVTLKLKIKDPGSKATRFQFNFL